MRWLCVAAASLGVAAAFLPSHVPSTSRTSSAAAAAAAQQNKVLFAASPRRSARRAAAVGEGGGGGAADVDDSGPVGVIVCDHGSRRENANTMLFDVAERYRTFSGFDIVEVRFDSFALICRCHHWHLSCLTSAGCVLDIGDVLAEPRAASMWLPTDVAL